MNLSIQERVPLAPFTTLELGGPARWYVETRSPEHTLAALRWAEEQGVRVFVLGGGSNLVIADDGFDGLVIHVKNRGVETQVSGDSATVRVAAGEPWDAVVADAVGRGLAGFECLSGIPGLAGATPIQNVGAYGQEVADTVRSVRVVDRRRLELEDLPARACEFSYRDSVFKREPDRYVVLGVEFRLRQDRPAKIEYVELARALDNQPEPSLAQIREAVITIRRSKSMLVEPEDENRRSVGSFFTNPVVPTAEADRVVADAVADGVVIDGASIPRWRVDRSQSKLGAAWLVEQAGFPRGYRRGSVGLSSRHALSLVHYGGGTTAELITLARTIQRQVLRRFGIHLQPEPRLLRCTL